MNFNALSIAKIGMGFGALAVSGIGLLAGIRPIVQPPHESSGGSRRGRHIPLKISHNDDDAIAMMLLINAL
jgi:hypothetical protein